jgi:hypothetical protein
MIIGKNWHTKTLADPNDRVRIEIEAALNRKIRITPVLVDGASVPPGRSAGIAKGPDAYAAN